MKKIILILLLCLPVQVMAIRTHGPFVSSANIQTYFPDQIDKDITINDVLSAITVDAKIDADNVLVLDSPETLNEILEDSLNSSVLDSITVTDVATLNISWGTGEIYDHGNKTIVETTSGSGECTDNNVNYLTWSSGTGLTLGTIAATGNGVAIAHIVCQDGDIWDIHNSNICSEREVGISRAIGAMFPSIVTTGLITSEDTDVTNVWDVTLSAGTYYHDGHEKHTISAPVYSRISNLNLWYRVGGVWTSSTNVQIDTTQWDNGTNLAGVTDAKYYRSNFFVIDDSIHWVYPQTEYINIAQAESGGCPTLPPGLTNEPRSTCVIIKGNDAAFPTAGGERWIDVRPRIGSSTSSSTSDHANLSSLDWSSSGHTVNSALDMNSNQISEVTTINVTTVNTTAINAYGLGGKLTGGANEIEGSNFDINGGAIDAVTLGTNSPITEAQIDSININSSQINSSTTITINPGSPDLIHLDADQVSANNNFSIGGNLIVNGSDIGTDAVFSQIQLNDTSVNAIIPLVCQDVLVSNTIGTAIDQDLVQLTDNQVSINGTINAVTINATYTNFEDLDVDDINLNGGDINIDGTTNARLFLDRAATGNEGGIYHRTAGVNKYFIGANSSEDYYIYNHTLESSVLDISAEGEVTKPAQPSFYAYRNGNLTNVTGGAAYYTIPYNVEVYDIGSNFNTANGIFTAPVTGKYMLTAAVRPTGIDATNTDFIYDIETSNRTYRCFRGDPAGSQWQMNPSAIVDMDAGDTAYIRIYSNGNVVVDVEGNATSTWFSGALLH